MPNPIKGEVMIEIGGKPYPLVFSYDAIAILEAEFDDSMMDIQMDMSRVAKVKTMLLAALGGAFTEDTLGKSGLPPIFEVIDKLRDALSMAYWGNVQPPKDTKKKTATKKKRSKN